MVSQFFILSNRGDCIVFRDYRSEVQKGTTEIFSHKVKFWKEDGGGDAPPIFGFYHGGSWYEMDFGYVQTTSTEVMKSYVFNDPIAVDAVHLPSLGRASFFVATTCFSNINTAAMVFERKREEIFVDVIEKISVTFSSSGYILTSEIDGTIQMKSYLGGNPKIRLALNNDLSVGRDYSAPRSGGVILDDCNFHELVHLDSFDVDRTLTMVAPEGELHVMNYRITKALKPPFRINALIEEAGPFKAELIVKVQADFSSAITANTVLVEIPVPPYVNRVGFELEPGTVENTTDFKESTKRVVWALKKIVGGSEHTLHARLTFSHVMHGNVSKEAGPINMST